MNSSELVAFSLVQVIGFSLNPELRFIAYCQQRLAGRERDRSLQDPGESLEAVHSCGSGASVPNDSVRPGQDSC